MDEHAVRLFLVGISSSSSSSSSSFSDIFLFLLSFFFVADGALFIFFASRF